MDKIRIIIADDEDYSRNKIKEELDKYEDIEILGIACNDEEEIQMIEELKPDIVLTDLMRNRKFTGLDIISKYSVKNKNINFYVISYTDESMLCERYGNVKGYINKFLNFDIKKLIYDLRLIKQEIKKSNKKINNRKSNIIDKIKSVLKK